MYLPLSLNIPRDCARTAVIDSTEAKPLYDSIVDFMEVVLGLSIPPGMREVPILAVDLPSLNEQRGNTSKVYHSSGSSGGTGAGITRGLTLKECGSVNHYSTGSMRWDGYSWVTTGPRLYKSEEVSVVPIVRDQNILNWLFLVHLRYEVQLLCLYSSVYQETWLPLSWPTKLCMCGAV